MKIAEIKPGANGFEIVAVVVSKGEVQTFRGKTFSQAVISDDTGTIHLNLWREQVDQVRLGDTVKVREAFCYREKQPLQIATWLDVTRVEAKKT